MHLGILTGGGDVPGLNAAIKAVVNEAHRMGWRVTAFRRGWAGPVNTDAADPSATPNSHMALTPDLVRAVDRTGGTFIHTSRTNPSRMKPDEIPDWVKVDREPDAHGRIDITSHVLGVLNTMEMDLLIAIGGDDTLSYAARIHTEGMKTMCIPKTMDNDVFGTDYCIGFSTCVTRSVEMINRLRTSAGSHERNMIVELFGRNCGLTALAGGYLADADRTLIAEVPFDLQRLADLLTEDRARKSSNYTVSVISEGARIINEEIIQSGEEDAYGHKKLGGIGERVAAGIKQLTGTNIMVQNLGYLLRSGGPDAVDLIVAKNYGTMCVQLIAEGKSGLMVGIRDGCYATQPADISTKGEHRVDVDGLYDIDQYRPKIARVEGIPMYLR
ncbi:6-phosphofructokinase [Hoeflea poritis]|uniref:6-phosphofructokinase n=1 Tax=Hoeflea poritis TaxID=2993659 RepID=A0ABT4VJQ1_9HYPH|nr:6-phosphofructokinase [Hoeflea poritis]MDA4844952.1 6-phosphofructokinase [Hoeflea poritis]